MIMYIKPSNKHFWKTNDYNKVRWFLLMSLQSDMDSKFQLKWCINDLKALDVPGKRPPSPVATELRLLKVKLNLILWFSKQQPQLNSQSQTVSTVNVRALIVKKRGP